MLKIAVCDDDEWIRQHIKTLISREIFVQADLFTSGEELLAEETSYDIYFLDICFKKKEKNAQLDGMETARRLRGRTDAVLIFITALQDYVYEAYDVEAFQYLLKPIDEEKFYRTLHRAVEKAEKRQAILPLLIRVNGRSLKIPIADIFYGESDGRKIILHTKDGVYTYYEKMELLEEKLGEGFFRSHRGFLVSLKEVAGYDRTSITLKCGDTVFLARQKYNDFVAAYMNYLTRG